MRRLVLALAALLPLAPSAHADDAAGCTYFQVKALPIRYVGANLEPAVDGTIDGTPATMLIDTGAFETQLTMNAVVRRKLELFMTDGRAEGVGGLSALYRARLKQFEIGPVHSRPNPRMLVIGDAKLTPAFDAIVGAPFLLQADLEFDLRAKQMRFYRPRNCSGTPLTLWQEATVAVPFVRNGDSSPNPHFTVVVNGKALDAIIDTGAQRSMLSRGAAKRAGIDVDAPGVTRIGTAGGVGAGRAPVWRAPVRTVDIGGEVIRDVELGIIESQGSDGADLYLGQDFLRAHRVLFAMSQEKVYLAYAGGQIFTRGDALEPWMREEAESGNPDAQYALAAAYNNGRGVARDPAQARSWLDKAAAAGQPHANLVLGRQLLQAGKTLEAIPKLRSALDQLPAERLGALWLYNARVQSGDAALARTELEAGAKRQRNDDWPTPILDFYLGKLDDDALLRAAAKDGKSAKPRTCQAKGYMAEWFAAKGDKAHADALMAAVRSECRPARPSVAP